MINERDVRPMLYCLVNEQYILRHAAYVNVMGGRNITL